MKIKLEDRKEDMDKEETKREPPEPMMKRSERNLPPHKGLVIELFYEGGDTEREEKESTDHSRPPDEVIPQKSCCYLSGHNLKV